MVTRVPRATLEVFLLESTFQVLWAIFWNSRILKGTGQATFHHYLLRSLPESSQNWRDPSPHRSVSPWATRVPAMLSMPLAARPQRKADQATITFRSLLPWDPDLERGWCSLFIFFTSPARVSEPGKIWSSDVLWNCLWAKYGTCVYTDNTCIHNMHLFSLHILRIHMMEPQSCILCCL